MCARALDNNTSDLGSAHFLIQCNMSCASGCCFYMVLCKEENIYWRGQAKLNEQQYPDCIY